MNRIILKTMKVLTAVGALNWGLDKFVNFNVLDLLGTGTMLTVAVAAIAVSGGYVGYQVIRNKL